MHHGTMHHRLTALATGIGVIAASVGIATSANASAAFAAPSTIGSETPALLTGPVPGPDDLSPGQLRALERDLGLDADGGMLVGCGTVPGTIAPAMRGADGFGYDPVFVPVGGDRSMAEMTREEKAAISHRGRAARRLAAVLGPPAPTV